jgi:EAL domain-containing protein (putative c-di-GMP-specific phosphodiesterase class I)/DNA-binding NarL/FixJ family response regulator
MLRSETMDYKPLILVTEDNEANRELIREILEAEGYRVNEAVNGKDGVEKALKEVPDLVLMDVEMPVMNGLDAIKALMQEEDTRRIPIIVLTGLNEIDDRIKAFDSGAMDYVNKPFDTEELIAHVRSYLRFSLLNKKYVLSTVNQETKLPNRAAFREKLTELENPKFFLIKMDNIESVSRFYGENTGTEIEKKFAGFLKKKTPAPLNTDTSLFHLGRGLFGFLTEDRGNQIDKTKSQTISKLLINQFANHQMVVKEFQHDVDLTVVICFDREKMLEKGELALEEALRNKTGIMIADDIIEDVHRTIGDNLFWLRKIKEAVLDERLMPFYQPIVNCGSGKVEKFESLVRMIDTDGSIVPPGKFLFIAKKSKYYHEITKIMLRKTMQQFADRTEGVSVNLSAMDIEDHGMRDFMIQSLERFPKTASRLTFEIVEQEGFKFFDILKEFIKQVKQYGVKIAIDDFGSGYSNFRTLIDMDVDFLKVDGSLIKNIHTDISSRNVVDTIKTFAEKTSMKIIAEFVENEEIFNCLKEMGIHYGQGYYIGKPEKL